LDGDHADDLRCKYNAYDVRTMTRYVYDDAIFAIFRYSART